MKGCFKNNNLKEIKNINSINKKEIENLNLEIKFHIIIDDGDHNPCAQVKTFENFYNYLDNDGIYIIEDVTDFRYNCLKVYLNFLKINYDYEKIKDIGSIIIKKQEINFDNKDKAYLKINDLEELKKHTVWWNAENKKINRLNYSDNQ